MVIGGNFVFIHVPKTAGMSITKALGGRSGNVPLHVPRSHIKTEVFTFGFVRNPWQRLVSLYRFLYANGRVADGTGFRDWLLAGESWLDEDIGFRQPLAPLQKRPQMWWLEGCDFVGRFERLEHDFAEACMKIASVAGDLGHENRGDDAAGWRCEYDDHSCEFVFAHHAADIERFDYAFSDGAVECAR
jgi:hypothetical protein